MLKGWRTILFNAGVAALLAAAEIAAYLTTFDWRELLPPGRAAAVVLAVNLLNIVLRVVTTTPVGRRG